jgi:stress-induced morphogen
MTTTGVARGSVGAAIKAKLTAAFSPTHMEIRNESHMHNV